MFTRAVVFKKDHRNKTKFLSNRLVSQKAFKFGDEMYTINDKHFQIVKVWRFGWRWHAVTYYYREGDPKPLPVPLFTDLEEPTISAGELEKIFTPWYYQIRTPNKNQAKDIQFWLAVLTGAGVGYLIIKVREIMEMLQAVGL